MFQIQILNKSTLISNASLSRIVAALQVQVNRDFTPIYNVGATLTLTSQDNGMTPIYIVNTVAGAPPGALAWHTVDNQGRPYGIIPMRIVLQAGAAPGPTISHELLELMADPTTNTSKVAVWPPNSRLPANIAYEDCDPVEDDSYSITTPRGAAGVSNFVLPSWFVPNSQGPWDFLQRLSGPLTMTPGGYLQWQRSGGPWNQVEAAHVRGFRACPNYHSRVYRRVRNFHELQFPGHHAMVRRAEMAIRRAGAPPSAIRTLIGTLRTTMGPDTKRAINHLLPRLVGRSWRRI
jgi:hypothetical protein